MALKELKLNTWTKKEKASDKQNKRFMVVVL
jgi:hypothetical protein